MASHFARNSVLDYVDNLTGVVETGHYLTMAHRFRLESLDQ